MSGEEIRVYMVARDSDSMVFAEMYAWNNQSLANLISGHGANFNNSQHNVFSSTMTTTYAGVFTELFSDSEGRVDHCITFTASVFPQKFEIRLS